MRYWQQFEQRCRSLVRSWGFDVPFHAVKKFGREFDIYGEHVLLQNRYFCPPIEQQPLIMIGECKTSDTSSIDATSIDQLLARREDVRQELGHHTAAYLFTAAKTTAGAVRAAERHNIGIITERQVNKLAVHALLADGPGRLERTSLPNFDHVDHLLDFLVEMTKLPQQHYTIRELQEKVHNAMSYDPEKWTRDFIQHAVLLGLADFDDTSTHTYSLKDHALPVLTKFKSDKSGWYDYLRRQVLQLPWHREILHFTKFHNPSTKKAIHRGLEDFRPGFDYVSLNVAISMLQQLDLLDDLKPTEEAGKLLWT